MKIEGFQIGGFCTSTSNSKNGAGGVKGGINGRQYLHFGAPPLLHLAIYLNDLFKA